MPTRAPGRSRISSRPRITQSSLLRGHLREIERAIREVKAAGLSLDELRRENFDLAALRPLLDEIRFQISDGRGFVVLRRLPVEEYSKDEIGMIFWGIGTHLGRGLSQSVLGDRFGHVKDFSREDPLARAYRNKQELSPHTDSADLVGLACLRDAQTGGVSQLFAFSKHSLRYLLDAGIEYDSSLMGDENTSCALCGDEIGIR